ncbi:MAG: imidazoleglycerol-phosphate dehydratase HisB [Armatimonadota bacterium]|nr:imidazoleglycerol-phosphate dehydratase HisB [Armatimonadota bacterium]MDR5697013.1 imidazoleglycerol-phosphate dehydratase HisB [Armatimonadota bacterium]
MRSATVARTTAETSVRVSLNLDGTGRHDVRTGIGFFDHVLAQLACHGGFDLTVVAEGDLEVDAHHTVEDVGITLGQALSEALSDRSGIARFASLHAAMDDALVLCAVDAGGRPFLACDLRFSLPVVGAFPTELVEEFLRAFVTHGRLTAHVRLVDGHNSHHIVEAVFKGLGVVLRRAVAVERQGVPSTKGVL